MYTVEYSGFRIHPVYAMTFPRFHLFRELRTKKSLSFPATHCRFRRGIVVSGKALLFPTRVCRKNTQLLLSTSRDAASWKNAHTGSITLQENLLTVIRTDLCARCTGFPQLHQVFGAMSTSMHTTNLCIKQLRT